MRLARLMGSVAAFVRDVIGFLSPPKISEAIFVFDAVVVSRNHAGLRRWANERLKHKAIDSRVSSHTVEAQDDLQVAVLVLCGGKLLPVHVAHHSPCTVAHPFALATPACPNAPVV